MKVLVTGGAGFIGSNLSLELERLGHEVTVVDNYSSTKKGNLEGFGGRIIEKDVSRDFAMEKEFDAIFHLASITDTTFGDDNEMMRQNVEGFKNVLAIARPATKFVYASSAGVYGSEKVPMKEGEDEVPLNAYAESKLMLDKIAREKYGEMHIVGLRYFNVFGPREKFKGKSSSMIYQLRNQILEGKNPRIFYDGEQKRDHIYVKDVVEATIKALEAKEPGTYNVGTGVATSFNQIIEYLNELLGTDKEADYFDNPIKEVYQHNTQADTTKSRELMGWEAKYSVKEGMKDYFEWLDARGE